MVQFSAQISRIRWPKNLRAILYIARAKAVSFWQSFNGIHLAILTSLVK